MMVFVLLMYLSHEANSDYFNAYCFATYSEKVMESATVIQHRLRLSSLWHSSRPSPEK